MSYLSKTFKHLDGQTMPFKRFREEIEKGMQKDLVFPVEVDWHDVYRTMFEMGWITMLHDGESGNESTIKFAICEDKREIKKRKETYKKHFVHHAAQRFIHDLKLGRADIPARFKSGEYKEAVRELLHDSKLPE